MTFETQVLTCGNVDGGQTVITTKREWKNGLGEDVASLSFQRTPVDRPPGLLVVSWSTSPKTAAHQAIIEDPAALRAIYHELGNLLNFIEESQPKPEPWADGDIVKYIDKDPTRQFHYARVEGEWRAFGDDSLPSWRGQDKSVNAWIEDPERYQVVRRGGKWQS